VADNRIHNLRDVPLSLNQKNAKLRCDNTSGVSGVTWNRSATAWEVTYRDAGRRIYIGLFNDLGAARAAHAKATKQAGFTERHGT
jgi:hypothetical protein